MSLSLWSWGGGCVGRQGKKTLNVPSHFGLDNQTHENYSLILQRPALLSNLNHGHNPAGLEGKAAAWKTEPFLYGFQKLLDVLRKSSCWQMPDPRIAAMASQSHPAAEQHETVKEETAPMKHPGYKGFPASAQPLDEQDAGPSEPLRSSRACLVTRPRT